MSCGSTPACSEHFVLIGCFPRELFLCQPMLYSESFSFFSFTCLCCLECGFISMSSISLICRTSTAGPSAFGRNICWCDWTFGLTFNALLDNAAVCCEFSLQSSARNCWHVPLEGLLVMRVLCRTLLRNAHKYYTVYSFMKPSTDKAENTGRCGHRIPRHSVSCQYSLKGPKVGSWRNSLKRKWWRCVGKALVYCRKEWNMGLRTSSSWWHPLLNLRSRNGYSGTDNYRSLRVNINA